MLLCAFYILGSKAISNTQRNTNTKKKYSDWFQLSNWPNWCYCASNFYNWALRPWTKWIQKFQGLFLPCQNTQFLHFWSLSFHCIVMKRCFLAKAISRWFCWLIWRSWFSSLSWFCNWRLFALSYSTACRDSSPWEWHVSSWFWFAALPFLLSPLESSALKRGMGTSAERNSKLLCGFAQVFR